MGIINAIKDRSVSELTKFILNKTKLERYGKMQTLNIDSDNKEITTSLVLKGEKESIEIWARYQIKDDRIIISRIASSREWLTELVKELPAEMLSIDIETIPWPTKAALKVLGII